MEFKGGFSLFYMFAIFEGNSSLLFQCKHSNGSHSCLRVPQWISEWVIHVWNSDASPWWIYAFYLCSLHLSRKRSWSEAEIFHSNLGISQTKTSVRRQVQHTHSYIASIDNYDNLVYSWQRIHCSVPYICKRDVIIRILQASNAAKLTQALKTKLGSSDADNDSCLPV